MRAASEQGGPAASLALSSKGQREVRKKLKLKERFDQQQRSGQPQLQAAPGGGCTLPQAVPAGNFNTPSWLTTDLGQPLEDGYELSEEAWGLTLRYGAVERRVTLGDVEALASWRRYDGVSWHCVTGWSKLGLSFHGVPMADLLALLGLPAAAAARWRFALQHGADGYMAPVFREDLLSGGAFFAVRDGGGRLLCRAHGGPRVCVPALWGWKSAKWMTALELSDEYQPGFWENLVCHARGRVCDEGGRCVEERWASGCGLVSDVLTGMANLFHKAIGPRAYAAVMLHGGRAVGWAGSSLLQVQSESAPPQAAK